MQHLVSAQDPCFRGASLHEGGACWAWGASSLPHLPSSCPEAVTPACESFARVLGCCCPQQMPCRSPQMVQGLEYLWPDLENTRAPAPSCSVWLLIGLPAGACVHTQQAACDPALHGACSGTGFCAVGVQLPHLAQTTKRGLGRWPAPVVLTLESSAGVWGLGHSRLTSSVGGSPGLVVKAARAWCTLSQSPGEWLPVVSDAPLRAVVSSRGRVMTLSEAHGLQKVSLGEVYPLRTSSVSWIR